jgi:uncharacterized protein (UPF0147 family)
MNTLKTVYNKLFTEKVELAKHEVELGVVEDVKNYLKAVQAMKKGFEKDYNLVKKHIDALKSPIQNVVNNKDVPNNLEKKALEFKNELQKLANEIGVKLEGSETSKTLNEIFANIEECRKLNEKSLSLYQSA